MNNSVFMMINTAVSGADVFACGSSMPKIIYHGLGFYK